MWVCHVRKEHTNTNRQQASLRQKISRGHFVSSLPLPSEFLTQPIAIPIPILHPKSLLILSLSLSLSRVSQDRRYSEFPASSSFRNPNSLPSILIFFLNFIISKTLLIPPLHATDFTVFFGFRKMLEAVRTQRYNHENLSFSFFFKPFFCGNI